ELPPIWEGSRRYNCSLKCVRQILIRLRCRLDSMRDVLRATPRMGGCSARGAFMRSAEVDMEPTKEMVYIVDDDPRVREALSSLLRASGKRVRIFSSGQEFLDCRREDSSACLILDLKMP